VEQLRTYPARPSAAEVQANLYLVDAKGGTPTLIASEPEPWLSVCEAPCWSHAGDQIIFHARTGVTTNSISRVKGLDLGDGRLRIKDLGSGACPAFSPGDDRIIFLLPVETPDEHRFAPPDLSGGVWMMQSDGEGRRKLAGTGRPRWSPDGHQFLVVNPAEPREVTVIDDRVGAKSGVLEVQGGKIFSMPAWAEPGTIVAALGIDSRRPGRTRGRDQPRERAGEGGAVEATGRPGPDAVLPRLLASHSALRLRGHPGRAVRPHGG
jgi:Tol biopolymer transport system component